MPLVFGHLLLKPRGAVCKPQTGEQAMIARVPFRIGKGGDFCPQDCNWGSGWVEVAGEASGARIEAVNGDLQLWINGDLAEVGYLQPGQCCHLVVGGQDLMIYWGEAARDWLNSVTQRNKRATELKGIEEKVQILPPAKAAMHLTPEPLPGRGQEDEAGVNAKSGELTCPHCWLRFDLGDVKHVSVHESLKGDPILGPKALLRFHAVRFDDQFRGLDAHGVPCHELACPHCHRVLPPTFIEVPQFMYSIVGAPSAGKSYFISAMLREVQERLARCFGASLKDADPAGNAVLNAMKAKLFQAGSAEEAVLLKTQLHGEMYQPVMRHGREVMMPRPFMFQLSYPKTGMEQGVTFYDNAGENFEPGVDLNETPGAQHVIHSAAIFFLFDPTASEAFRRQLSGYPDPQLAMEGRLDQQEVLLTEMEIRVRKLAGLGARERWNRPLLFLVGKWDVWRGLFLKHNPSGFAPVEKPSGAVDWDGVVANSGALREFLQSLCPSVVSIAEGLTEEVIYFPVSALGHSPSLLPNGQLAPDPAKLRPEGVAEPVLWAWSQLEGWDFLLERGR